MKSINIFLVFGLLSVSNIIHSSDTHVDTPTTTLTSLLTIHKSNQAQFAIYQNAKNNFERLENIIKQQQKEKKIILENTQQEYNKAIRAWYGKPWNHLTKAEKSDYYKEFTDSYSSNTWNTLKKHEKTKYNIENSNLYCGQCKNLYCLNKAQEENLHNIQALSQNSLQTLDEATKEYVRKSEDLMKIEMLKNAVTTDLVIYTKQNFKTI